MRRFSLAALIVVIGVSPRIPLPIAVPGRDFDFRVEDLLTPLLWALFICQHGKIRVPRIVGFMVLYLLPVLVASAVGISRNTTVFSRALLFGLKEVEYFSICLLAFNLTRSVRDVRLVANLLLSVAVANAGWVLWQHASGQNARLFNPSPELTGAYSYSTSRILESYGPGLVGELSPFSVGGFFMIAFLVALARTLVADVPREKWVCLAVASLTAFCLLTTESRVNIGGGLLGAGLMGVRFGARKFIRAMAFLLLTAGLLGYYVETSGVSSRLSSSAVEHSTAQRSQDIWPVVINSGPWLLVGFGKGSLAYAETLPITEAHNYYLRVVAESGVLGLAAFLGLVYSAIATSAKLFLKGTVPIAKAMGSATMCVGLALIGESIFQDAFVAVIPNEFFWLLAGVTMAASRLELTPIVRPLRSVAMENIYVRSR